MGRSEWLAEELFIQAVNPSNKADTPSCNCNAQPVGEFRGYQEPFDITQLTPRRNDDVYSRINWIVESDYFQTLLARKPPNDDPEVINLIR